MSIEETQIGMVLSALFSSCMFQVEDLWVHFHEILYECYGGHHKLVLFSFAAAGKNKTKDPQTRVTGPGVLSHWRKELYRTSRSILNVSVQRT
jgi:hypothetical protein